MYTSTKDKRLSVHFIETSPRLRAEQAARVPGAVWHERLEEVPEGPLLLFELQVQAPATPAAAAPRPVRAPTSVEVDGQSVAVATIRSAAVQSLPEHPHIFSWWLLLCLGGLLLLPFPLLFWPLQLTALAGWILLGSRKQHRLVLVLRDGRALRHNFANRRTALAHRNGIRKAIGQGPDAP